MTRTKSKAKTTTKTKAPWRGALRPLRQTGIDEGWRRRAVAAVENTGLDIWQLAFLDRRQAALLRVDRDTQSGALEYLLGHVADPETKELRPDLCRSGAVQMIVQKLKDVLTPKTWKLAGRGLEELRRRADTIARGEEPDWPQREER